MKNNLFVGLALIAAGLMLALYNFGYIDWSIWMAIADLWPLIFVVIGVSIIFKHKPWVNGLAWSLFLLVLIAYGFYMSSVSPERWRNSFPGNQFREYEERSFSYDYSEGIKNAKLSLELGAGNITVESDSTRLLSAVTTNPYIESNPVIEGENASFQFSTERMGMMPMGRDSYSYDFKLGNKALWDIEVDCGAIDSNFDLAGIPVSSLDIDSGAADIEIQMGSLQKDSTININSGASDISIAVPSTSGVRVYIDAALKSNNLDSLGWSKKNDYYESPNYAQAENKINIELNTGVGNFQLTQTGSNI